EEGDIWLWDAATGKRRAITQTTDAESAPHFTFDEKRVTFVRANNVFAVDLAGGETTQLTNVAGPDDKGPNVTLWDDKKGTDSQEVVKKEEKQLLDVVARRAKRREEDEAKKKREHPLKPFKLAKGQTIGDGRLTPDGKSGVVGGREARLRRGPLHGQQGSLDHGLRSGRAEGPRHRVAARRRLDPLGGALDRSGVERQRHDLLRVGSDRLHAFVHRAVRRRRAQAAHQRRLRGRLGGAVARQT